MFVLKYFKESCTKYYASCNTIIKVVHSVVDSYVDDVLAGQRIDAGQFKEIDLMNETVRFAQTLIL